MSIQVIFVFSFGHYVFSRILDNTIRLSAALKFSNRHYDTNRRNYHSQSSASYRIAFYTLGKTKPLNKILRIPPPSGNLPRRYNQSLFVCHNRKGASATKYVFLNADSTGGEVVDRGLKGFKIPNNDVTESRFSF